MRAWRELPAERTQLYCPIGLLPRDEMTGGVPIGRVRALLDIDDGSGGWRETGIRATVTPGGVITYPGLGRVARPAGQAPRNYRVRVEADHYIPFYRRVDDGIAFVAHPYDDANPPAAYADVPVDVMLTPAANYPFEGHLFVIRGVVVDAATTAPVRDVLVSIGNTRRAITGERGDYAVALPPVALPSTLQVDAVDARGNRQGSAPVQLPQDLGSSIEIAIS